MRSEYVDNAVFDLILRRMTPDNALAVRLSLVTGLRIGDCLKVRVGDIRGNKLHYVAEKTNKKGCATLPPGMAKVLKRNARDGEFVFAGRKPGTHRTRQAVWSDLKKCAREIGVAENVTPHSARKGFAVESVKELPFSEVQRLLQHTSSGVTLLYTNADKMQKNVEKIHNSAPLTQKMCENCVFSCGLDVFAELVANKLLRAFNQANLSPGARAPGGGGGE